MEGYFVEPVEVGVALAGGLLKTRALGLKKTSPNIVVKKVMVCLMNLARFLLPLGSSRDPSLSRFWPQVELGPFTFIIRILRALGAMDMLWQRERELF